MVDVKGLLGNVGQVKFFGNWNQVDHWEGIGVIVGVSCSLERKKMEIKKGHNN